MKPQRGEQPRGRLELAFRSQVRARGKTAGGGEPTQVPGGLAPARDGVHTQTKAGAGAAAKRPAWQRPRLLRGPVPMELQIPGSCCGSARRGQKPYGGAGFVHTGSLCAIFFALALDLPVLGWGGGSVTMAALPPPGSVPLQAGPQDVYLSASAQSCGSPRCPRPRPSLEAEPCPVLHPTPWANHRVIHNGVVKVGAHLHCAPT